MRYTTRMATPDPLAALPQIEALTRSERAYDALESAIVHCQLPPGTALSDRQLSEALGVSRTPIREAMHSLEAAGLVVRRGGRFVVAGFTTRDARELFELRRRLEPAGLEHLAESWDPAGVHELSTFFDEFPKHLPDGPYDEYLKRDHQFHKLIVEWSDNSRLVQFYEIVEKQINRIRHYLAPGYRGRMEQVVHEHQEICDAIARKDVESARAALLSHLRKGEQAMIEYLASQRNTEQSS
ncbi:MAG: FCD domain-containing protein [Pseudonocardiaceae bacterium]|nr:FCD domain-containing protein [Pseudonocardiaceae bacterium]